MLKEGLFIHAYIHFHTQTTYTEEVIYHIIVNKN